jgi:hypothetical protein
MTVLRVATVLSLLALALPGSGVAQGLGDAAAREKARREKQEARKKAPVLTNEDLDKGRPPTSGTSTGSETAPAAAGSETRAESPPPEDRFAAERPYLDAVTQAQTRVSQVEARIQELGAKLNPMSTSFIYGSQGSGSANEEAEVRAELSQAQGELTQARQELVAATQALQDVRQGRPPGGSSVPR